MATSRAEGKRSLREISEEDEEETEEEDTGEDDKNKKGKKGLFSGSSRSTPVSCQADDCDTNLSNAKPYHRRHKVCEYHAKAFVVAVAGKQQRFCQQCSRFHELLEFDDSKRSCRRRLAGHNERRRKSSSEYQGEGSI